VDDSDDGLLLGEDESNDDDQWTMASLVVDGAVMMI
jgi:hypothetical protein